MTKTDAAVQTLSGINPDVVLEVKYCYNFQLAYVSNKQSTTTLVCSMDSSVDLVFQSYTLNITTVQGFETFMSSLTNKSFRPYKEGSGVDLVLSCVDNYEARMVVNQVRIKIL